MAQNAITYVGAQGTVANNTIVGSGDLGPPVCAGQVPSAVTGVLLFGAHDVTVDHNTITGAGTDQGVSVTAASTNITISFNQVGRTAPDTPDPTGHGIDVGDESSATLICNTFTGWNINIVGAMQIGCTPLPDGIECHAYSAHTPDVEGGTAPFDWTTTTGSLPPGLTLAADGTITGTPTRTGTFPFTVQAADSSQPQLTATQDQSITITPDCATTTSTPVTAAAVTTTPVTPAPVTTAAPAATTPISQLPVTGSSKAFAILGAAVVLSGVALAARRKRSR